MAARYIPAASESEVGGDWYDVIPIDSSRVGLVMGDVAGKGLAAASMVGRLRSAMRAYALEGREPADVIGSLNQLVWSEVEDSEMATLVYVVVDPVANRITWVNAGHPPPLILVGDGSTSFLEGPRSVPLGVMPFPSYEEGSRRWSRAARCCCTPTASSSARASCWTTASRGWRWPPRRPTCPPRPPATTCSSGSCPPARWPTTWPCWRCTRPS